MQFKTNVQSLFKSKHWIIHKIRDVLDICQSIWTQFHKIPHELIELSLKDQICHNFFTKLSYLKKTMRYFKNLDHEIFKNLNWPLNFINLDYEIFKNLGQILIVVSQYIEHVKGRKAVYVDIKFVYSKSDRKSRDTLPKTNIIVNRLTVLWSWLLD